MACVVCCWEKIHNCTGHPLDTCLQEVVATNLISEAEEEPQSQKTSHEQHQRIFWTIRGAYRSLPSKTRLFAPESSPERSAKSLSHCFFCPIILRCQSIRQVLGEEPNSWMETRERGEQEILPDSPNEDSIRTLSGHDWDVVGALLRPRLSFLATEPPDPRRVSEGVSEGFLRGSHTCQPKESSKPLQSSFQNRSKAFQEGVEIDAFGFPGVKLQFQGRGSCSRKMKVFLMLRHYRDPVSENIFFLPTLLRSQKGLTIRQEKGTQTQTFWSGYLRVAWGSSTWRGGGQKVRYVPRSPRLSPSPSNPIVAAFRALRCFWIILWWGRSFLLTDMSFLFTVGLVAYCKFGLVSSIYHLKFGLVFFAYGGKSVWSFLLKVTPSGHLVWSFLLTVPPVPKLGLFFLLTVPPP